MKIGPVSPPPPLHQQIWGKNIQIKLRLRKCKRVLFSIFHISFSMYISTYLPDFKYRTAAVRNG